MAIVVTTCTIFTLSLGALLTGLIPPFTEDASRALNVVHVVDVNGGEQNPVSFVSLFSTTPGSLLKETQMDEGFVCGTNRPLDFVTFSVKYGCWTERNAEVGWSKSDLPTLTVASDEEGDIRTTRVLLETKISTRWSLAINTDEIDDFQLKDNLDELIPFGEKSSSDGWHIIQFSGGKHAPNKFNLTLHWIQKQKRLQQEEDKQNQHLLLKLRTDVNVRTRQVENVLKKLPGWCSLFGKSTSPLTLAFLNSLPVVI